MNVLIIDDSIAIARKLNELISENKAVHILGQAQSVRQAIDMLGRLNPDVVFLDISLPDGSGMEVLIHIKKVKPEIKVIVFSNSANSFYQKKFTEQGSDYFLDKSKDFTKIPSIISSLVA
jgi:DNA-binding NarL/FixJ family response regulator